MKYCKRCVMPDTRPGIKFDENGVCYPCLAAEKRKKIDWKERQKELKKLCDKYKRKDGYYDCAIPASGGKDSHFQTYIMKEVYGMNPLIISVSDGNSFTQTETGRKNLQNLTERFGVDLVTYSLSPVTTRKMMRIAFEEFGLPNWPIDLAIYSIPLKIAHFLNIPLIVYGENVSYEYGGPYSEETYSVKNQIKNNVVKPIDWKWWKEKGISDKEVEMLKYPTEKVIDEIDPIYLSYFYQWDGRANYEFAKKQGWRHCKKEWDREGFIENFDQVDSLGYIVHPWLKYPKYGHAMVTDRASAWIRNGYITRKEAVQMVKEKEGILDQQTLDDFLRFTSYSDKEFWGIVEKFWNKDIFEKVNGQWQFKEPIWEQDWEPEEVKEEIV